MASPTPPPPPLPPDTSPPSDTPPKLVPIAVARYPRWITWGVAFLIGLFVLLLLARWLFGAR